jgi:xylulokinase
MSIVFNFTGGSLLKWMRDTFFDEWAGQAAAAGMDIYDMMLNNLPANPTNLFVLPHFTTTGTPHLDTQARGAIVGLQLGTKRNEILRAVLEGVTYEMALNAKLQRESGIEIGEYRAIGGGARSKVWMQIKADIFGKPIVRMENDEAGCLGAAMLGLAAVKDYASIADAVKALAKPTSRFEPNAKTHALYAERVELYAKLYPSLKEVSHGLGKLKNA